jgi:hypothetical protein
MLRKEYTISSVHLNIMNIFIIKRSNVNLDWGNKFVWSDLYRIIINTYDQIQAEFKADFTVIWTLYVASVMYGSLIATRIIYYQD